MKWKILTLFILFLALHTASAATVTNITWYQVQGTHLIPVNYVTPNVPYLVKLHIYTDTPMTTRIEVKADIPYWFDSVIASKYVYLHKGDNVVEVRFTYHHKATTPVTGVRGFFVKVEGLYDLQSVIQRFSTNDELKPTYGYFASLIMYVNGRGYDVNSYAPVPIGANVRISGYLYNASTGKPQPNYKIRWIRIDLKTTVTYTDSSGYLSLFTVAPNWTYLHLCGKKIQYYQIQAIAPNGAIYAQWDVNCKCVCQKSIRPSNVHFEVEKVWISPTHPRVGQKVIIYATIKNTGKETGTENVNLFIGNIKRATNTELKLKPGQEKTVNWWYLFLYKGWYTLTVSTSDSFLVKQIYVGAELTTPTPTPTIPSPIPSPSPTIPSPTPTSNPTPPNPYNPTQPHNVRGNISIVKITTYAVAAMAIAAAFLILKIIK